MRSFLLLVVSLLLAQPAFAADCNGLSVAIQQGEQVSVTSCNDGINSFPLGAVQLAANSSVELYHVENNEVISLLNCENSTNQSTSIPLKTTATFTSWKDVISDPKACEWTGNQLFCSSKGQESLFCFAMVRQAMNHSSAIQAAATVKSFTKSAAQLDDELEIKYWLAQTSDERQVCLSNKPAVNLVLVFYVRPSKKVVSFDPIPTEVKVGSADECIIQLLSSRTPPSVTDKYKLTVKLFE